MEFIKLIIGLVILFSPALIIAAVIYLATRKPNAPPQQQYNPQPIQQFEVQQQIQQQQIETQPALPYIVNKRLLTNKEQLFYNSLKPMMDKYGYIVLCKIRLADILTVSAPQNDYMAWFNKINRKHIDFIICNRNVEPLLFIEIDDWSHDKSNRIERDKFIDSIFKQSEYNLLHIRTWNVETLEQMVIDNMKKNTP